MRDVKVMVGIGLAGAFGLGLITGEALHKARQDEAYDLVVTWRNRLEADKDETGSWKKWPSETLPENDPWGNPLRIRYGRNERMVTLTVSSDGPDKKQWSPDDIAASVSDVEWAKKK